MSDDLRVGVIGYGLAGEVFHAPLIEAVEGLRVSAIVTSRPARVESAREAYPDAQVVVEVEQVWEHVDAVVVAAPNRAHVPIALEAIRRGVPVVVDKPLAVSAADAARVLSAAEQAGVLLSVFQNRRWDGDFLTVRRLVSEDALGQVVRFESRFDRFRPEVTAGAWRELAAATEGGGLLLDLGSHLVDQARELFGDPVRVYAELERRREGAEVDDDTFVALEHPGGERSHLWMSALAPLHGPRLRVSGLRAGVETHGLDPQEAQLAEGVRPGDERYGRGGEARVAGARGEETVELERGAYPVFYERLRDALRDDGPPPVEPRDSLAGLRILEAAARSARTHSVIDMGETT